MDQDEIKQAGQPEESFSPVEASPIEPPAASDAPTDVASNVEAIPESVASTTGFTATADHDFQAPLVDAAADPTEPPTLADTSVEAPELIHPPTLAESLAADPETISGSTEMETATTAAAPSWVSEPVSEPLAPSPPAPSAEEVESPAPPVWQSSDAESGESYGTDAPPPVWMSPPLSDAPGTEGEPEVPTYQRPAEPHIEMPQGGPNWMLAFVCAWAAFTSFMEAPVAYAAKETMVNGSTITLTASDRMYGGLGFALLGLGLLLFGIEALMWGRRRRGVSALLSIGLPVAVSLVGVVFLVLSHYPGSRI